MAAEEGEAPATVASPALDQSDNLLPVVLNLKRVTAPEELIDNYLDALIEAQAAEHELDTEQDEATVELPADGGPVGVVFTGDWHVGNRWTDHALLREHLRLIRETPGLYWVGMGDYADLFLGRKAGIGVQQHVMPLDMQRRAVQRLMVDGKALAYLAGNHDRWLWQMAGVDYVREAAEAAGRPYLGYGGILWIHVGEQRYKVIVWHDYPGRSAINPGNNQRRVRADYGGADVVVLAHLHNNYRQEGTTKAGDYLDLRSGTYKRRDDHAAQTAGAKTGDPRMPLIILWPDEHLVWAFRDFSHPKVLATFALLREQYGHGKGRGVA
ncbi:MAG: metallophosphoesterase [Bacillota bacterium]